MSTAPECDVAVVGCGPVGVVLAGLLAARGLRVVAFDKDVDIFALPRAAHFDQEIMRIVQELGCADEVAPSTIVNPGMDFLTADRQVLLSMRAGAETLSGWPSSILFHQPGFERALRAAAVRLGAELRLGVEVVGIDDGADRSVVRTADGGSVPASYVVACDGARSLVRKQLGIDMDDLQFEEPWLVLDLVLAEGVRPPSEVTLQVCDPARPHTLVPMPSPRFRFEFMLLPGETAADVDTPQQVRAMLAPWLGADDAVVERSAVYTFHGLIAREWRRGRVLLAGDAAHQMPPFLGQGMCSGLRDAANLAWKLERVLRHGASDDVLDTYQSEREPHVRSIVGSAVGFGRLICTTDPVVARDRDAAMLAARAAGGGKVEGAALPRLGASPLLPADGGVQAPQPMVDGLRFDDVVGSRFVVVARSAGLLEGAGARWWESAGAVLMSADDHPELTPMLDAAACDVMVVRPDRYVMSAGSSLPLPLPDESIRALISSR